MDMANDFEKGVVEVDAPMEEDWSFTNEEPVNRMAGSWDRLISEFNVAKALRGHKDFMDQLSPAKRDAASSDQGPSPVAGQEKADVVQEASANHVSNCQSKDSSRLDDLYKLCDQVR